MKAVRAKKAAGAVATAALRGAGAADIHLIGCSSPDVKSRGATEQTIGFKAYNLLRMAQMKLPVPPAFVLGTSYCRDEASRRLAATGAVWQPGLRALESACGRKLGDPRKPLLLSVRSGAPVSMPGMMETLLNIGLCDATVGGMIRQTGNPRLVWDAYRRLVECYGEVVAGIPAQAFAADRMALLGKDERDPDFAELRELTRRYLELFAQSSGSAFPQAPAAQLAGAIGAVLHSWQSPKARDYRRLNRIDDAIGTAVTVQAMVFGNAGGQSGAGVGFTRDPSTGAPEPWVDFLFNAQGEDVVSGRRTAHGHDELAAVLPAAWQALVEAAGKLERELRDMQDFEFTVQEGRLYMLQTRTGKRTRHAAARIALDMHAEGLIGTEVALERTRDFDASNLELTRVVSSEGRALEPLAHAATASWGVAIGEVALDEPRVQVRRAAGVAALLVRRNAETSDIAALEAACGLLTQNGARTSHAAVVARQLGKVCLVGCPAMQIDEAARTVSFGATVLREGDLLTLDGNDGSIYLGAAKTAVDQPAALLARLEELRRA